MISSATVDALQQRISEMQPLRLDDRALPTDPALRPLLPGGSLRQGASYAIRGSTGLALSLLAEASASGTWCGIIGLPEIGAEAAAKLGLALDRCALIPRPGSHALSIASTLSEVMGIILLHPAEARVTPREVELLSARLREHGSALVVLGSWPRTESELHVLESRWTGLGAGHGVLASRELTVRSRDRRGTRRHTLCFTRGRPVLPPHSDPPGVASLSERRLRS